MSEARERFAAARVAVLGTVGAKGEPHLVPVTFVMEGSTVWTAVDAKPKRPGGGRLRRVDNILARPTVSLLAQHWDEDWSRLWWVRADGHATVRSDAETVAATAARLRHKYDQYADIAVTGPVIEIHVYSWRSWGMANGDE